MTELILQLVIEHGLEDWTEWQTYKQIALINTNMLNYASEPKRLQAQQVKIFGQECIEYFENSKRPSQYSRKKQGLIEGVSKSYFISGKLQSKQVFKKGKREGISITFSENDNVQSIYFYANDEVEGKAKTFYDDGQLGKEVYYKNSHEHGECIFYYKNGNKLMKGYYDNGLRHGLFTQYYDTGKLRRETPYSKGHANGEIIEYYKHGGVSRRYNALNDLNDMDDKRYDTNGQITQHRIWLSGFLVNCIYCTDDECIYKDHHITRKQVQEKEDTLLRVKKQKTQN